jgi:hypothetical protein
LYLLLFIDRKWVFFNNFCNFFGVGLEVEAKIGHYRLFVGWLGRVGGFWENPGECEKIFGEAVVGEQ